MQRKLITKLFVCVMVVMLLVSAVSVGAKSRLKSEPATVKEWLVKYIGEQGTVANSDSDIKKFIKANKDLFLDINLSESVKAFDGMSMLFEAMEDETCTVTFNCEEQSDFSLLLKEVEGKNYKNNKCVKFGKTVWDFTLVVNASGLDVQPRLQRQRPNLKETATFKFIDAIPASFNIPVPIRVKNNSKAVLGEQKPTFNEGGIGAYDKDPQGVTVERNDEKIVIKGLKNSAEISSEYGAVWYTKDGSAPGTSPSANQVSYTFKTSIDVLYSVSLEPITDGAKEGLPTLKLDGKLVNNDGTPKAEVPEKDEFGRTLENNASLINRGTNSKNDSIGSNAKGADIRTAGRARVETGVRSTGFAEYGKKIEVNANPDTNKGFAVAYYNVEIYDPITCELVKSEKNLTEEKLSAILQKGIQGKTKIYVAYTNAAEFVKTDANGKALTKLASDNEPVFGVYSDEACTKLVAKTAYDKETGKVKTPALDLPVPSNNETTKTYYIKEQSAPRGYLLSTKVYKLDFTHKDGALQIKLTGDGVKGQGTETDPYMIANYRVGYTMVKYRVTQYCKTDISKGKGKTAGDKTEGIEPYAYDESVKDYGGKTGFLYGNIIAYNVVFTNTGDLPLTILVKDAFEKISNGGFEYLAVSAVNYKGEKITVSGKDNTKITLPVNKADTAEDESRVIVTFTCKLLKKTPALEEKSTGKTGYDVAGYESVAVSTATFKDPYTNAETVYAEDAKGNVVISTQQGAITEKNSATYTPVIAKDAKPENTDANPDNPNLPSPTPSEGNGNNGSNGNGKPQDPSNPANNGQSTGDPDKDQPHSGSMSKAAYAVAAIALALSIVAFVAVKRVAGKN